MSSQPVDSVNLVIQNLNKTTNQINTLITNTQDIIKVLPILFAPIKNVLNEQYILCT